MQQVQELKQSSIVKTEFAPVQDALKEEKPINLTDNLSQLMSEVNELKHQINYFADEKTRDDNLIK